MKEIAQIDNEQQYIVIFENYQKQNIILSDAVSEKDANSIMIDYIKKNGFKSYYLRIADMKYGKWIDYGSHSQFFKFVKPEMLDKVLRGDW